MINRQHTRPVLVLHERKTRVTVAARLTGKGAAETASVIMAVFKRLDPDLRRSITFDNVLCAEGPANLASGHCHAETIQHV